MQLEALQLLRNQREQGFEEASTHESLSTTLGTYRTLRIRLTYDGTVHSMSVYSVDDEAGYWSLQKGTSAKTKRFPALRLTTPLIDLDKSSPDWDVFEKLGRGVISNGLISEVVALLNSYCVSGKQNPTDLWDAWHEKAAPLLTWKNESDDPLIAQLIALVHAFGEFTGLASALVTHDDPKQSKARKISAEAVSQKLLQAVQGMLPGTTDKDGLEALTYLIVGKRIKERGRVKKIDSVQLCVDIHDPSNPFATIYTPQTREAVKRCLPKSSQQGICSLTGKHGSLLVTRFPSWLGKLPIYSKNQEAPCNARYDHTGLAGFPVLEDVARAITGGLAQMTAEGRKGRTWTLIYNGKGQRDQKTGGWREERDWLLVYPSFPVGDLRTIDAFQRTDALDGDAEQHLVKEFEDSAETLCARLNEHAPQPRDIPPYLQVLLVRKVSEGQLQLAFADDTPIDRFTAAVTAWRTSNLPTGLRLPLPSARSPRGVAWFRPRVLFPEQIGRLLTHQWMRAGTESSRAEAPPIGLVFELFLRKPGVWQQHAAQLLEVTLTRCAPLLTGAGRLLHLNPRDDSEDWLESWLKLFPATAGRKPDFSKPQPGRSFINSISLIGSLLHAMNSTLDQYTNDSAFLLGKLLAMMDELHRCYCVVERDGDIPNSLIGNGLLGRAGESPARAIEELLDRSRIYLGWAKTVAPPSDPKKESARIAVHSARKVLRLAASLSDNLHRANAFDEELTPIRKAHLFLGYLSPVLADGASQDTGGGVPQHDETQPSGAKRK